MAGSAPRWFISATTFVITWEWIVVREAFRLESLFCPFSPTVGFPI